VLNSTRIPRWSRWNFNGKMQSSLWKGTVFTVVFVETVPLPQGETPYNGPYRDAPPKSGTFSGWRYGKGVPFLGWRYGKGVPFQGKACERGANFQNLVCEVVPIFQILGYKMWNKGERGSYNTENPTIFFPYNNSLHPQTPWKPRSIFSSAWWKNTPGLLRM